MFLGVEKGGSSLGTEDTAGDGTTYALRENLQRHLLFMTKLILQPHPFPRNKRF